MLHQIQTVQGKCRCRVMRLKPQCLFDLFHLFRPTNTSFCGAKPPPKTRGPNEPSPGADMEISPPARLLRWDYDPRGMWAQARRGGGGDEVTALPDRYGAAASGPMAGHTEGDNTLRSLRKLLVTVHACAGGDTQ